eukprot:2942207-Prymnesium_polylepis.1
MFQNAKQTHQSPHARPARPIGPAKPPHVPRSPSHDLPARSQSIAPGPTGRQAATRPTSRPRPRALAY